MRRTVLALPEEVKSLLSPYVEAVEKLEYDILTGSSYPFPAMRDLLQVDDIKATNLAIWRISSQHNAPAHSRLLTTLMIYKLLDILVWIHGTPAGGVPKFMKAPHIESRPKKGWPKLQNWTKLLSQWAENMSEIHLTTLHASTTQLDFLKTSRILLGKIQGCQSLQNVNQAALFLNHILQGNTDVPDSLSDWLDQILPSSPSNELDRKVFIRDFPKTVNHFRLPLQLATLISPLFLLIPRLIDTVDYNRRDLFVTCMAFGNQKPELLMKVESLLWHAILRVARGESDIVNSLIQFKSEVPWDDISEVEDIDAGYFTVDERPGKDALAMEWTNTHLGGTPDGWPLLLLPSVPEEQVASGACDQDVRMPSSIPRDVTLPGENDDAHVEFSDDPGRPPSTPSHLESPPPTPRRADSRSPSPPPRPESRSPSTPPRPESRSSSTSSRPESHSSSTSPRPESRLPSTPARPESRSPSTPPHPESRSPSTPPRPESHLPSTPPRPESRLPSTPPRPESPNSIHRGSADAPSRLGSPMEEDSPNATPDIPPAASSNHSAGESEKSESSEASDYDDGNADKKTGTKRKRTNARMESAKKLRRSSRERITATSRQYQPPAHKLASQNMRPSSRRKVTKKSAQPAAAIKCDVYVWDVPSNCRIEGSRYNPINISDELPTPNLDSIANPVKYCGKKAVVYSPSGEAFDIIPTFHHQTSVEKFEALLNAIQASYIDGKPAHISKPESSVIHVMTDEEWEHAEDHGILEILRIRHIAVTNRRVKPWKFDEEGLSRLKLLTISVDMQDQSIRDESGDYRVQSLHGTLEQMLECASVPGGKGKILNALNFPMGDSDLTPKAYSSELVAWRATKDTPYCKSNVPIPGDDIRWALAATEGAVHWFHIDSDGFGTYIDVQTGKKLWIIARPKTGVQGICTHAFADIGLFLGQDMDLSTPCSDCWDLEALLLRPGDRLIMRPNTPHAVYTSEHAICLGGHFYATSTIQDTMFGLVHTFMASNQVSNTEHMASRNLLRRLAIYYHLMFVETDGRSLNAHRGHLPNLTVFEGVLDLMTVCIMTELANVLHVKTYSPGGLHPVTRMELIHARRKARHLMEWFFIHYQLQTPSGKVLNARKNVYWSYAVRIAKCIQVYKKAASHDMTNSEGNCTYQAVKEQLKYCFADQPLFEEAWEEEESKDFTSLAWPDDKPLLVVELQVPLGPLPHMAQANISAIDGRTFDDREYDKKYTVFVQE